MLVFLRACAFVFIGLIGFYDAAYAAGYTCTKTYTTCNAGYYLSSSTCYPCAAAGNGAILSSTSITGGTRTQKCSGYFTGGNAGANGLSQCTGCSASTWSCSCSSGYTSSGNTSSCVCNCNTVCTSVSNTTDTTSGSESCSITNGAGSRTYTNKCSGYYTNTACSSAGQTCTGCSTYGTRVSTGTCYVTSCNTGYSKNATSNATACNCTTPCTSVNNTSSTQSCTPGCSVANGTCSYTANSGSQTCNGKYTNSACSSAGGSCSGCSSWGACTGGSGLSVSCNSGYYKNGNACTACTSVSWTDSGTDTGTETDTSGCTATSQTVTVSITNGSYKQNQTRSGSRTRSWSQSKSRTCYRTGGAGGTNGSSACTGSNCGSYTYGTKSYGAYGSCSYSSWSNSGGAYGYSCNAGTYWNGSACAACTAGYYCPGFSNTNSPTNGTGRTACPTAYPNSDAGAGAITSCYSNSKSRAWSGSQTACSTPGNSYSHTCNSCSGSACSYVAYSNSAGTGDGTVKSGCSSNAAACTQSVASFTCKAGYYKNGSACSACPSGYPNSDNGNSTGITACYSNSKSRAWSGSQTACSAPGNSYSHTCNSCSGSACSYVAYSNSAGTGDGTVKSGCSSNAAACTQSVASFTCKAGYYKNGSACSACGAGTYQGSNGSTATSCTTCAAGTYNTTTGNSSCATCGTGKYCTGGQNVTNCPTAYPNSDAGAGAITSCYSNSKSRAWTGGQNACTKPSNCATVECNACSGSACSYVAYSNSAGTGDGTIKSGCSTNATNCNQTVKSVTANANYYVNGTSCSACNGVASGAYPLSDGGAIGSGYCYTSKTNTGSQVNGSVPTNCASVTEWNACTPGTCTWKDYYTATDTSCTPTNCTKTVKSVTANANSYVDGTSCKTCSSFNSGYPKSDGGNIGSAYCYKDATKTGSQLDPSMPTGCASRSLTACSPGTCTYKDYYSATDTTCTPTNCTKAQSCTSASANYYLDSGTAKACSAFSSTYPLSDGGNITNAYCYASKTNTGSQVNGSVPTNCASVTEWNACTPGTCTWKDYYTATDTSCTPTNCTKTVKSVAAKSGYRVDGTSCTACPSGYPNSDNANTGGVTSCYSNSKSRTWTGSQVDGTVPTNCSKVTEWNACSIGACSYVAYSNSAGTGDGTIKSGCSTNNSNCTKTVKSVAAKSGYRVDGTSCTACPSGYPNSAADNTGGVTACYSNSKSREWSGSQTACSAPGNSYSHTCNSCSGSACSYVAYSNSAGTGDGTVKSGCSSNAAACTQSVASFTCKAGYYKNGSACSACGAGTYQGSNGSTATSCTTCADDNTWSDAGASGCTACSTAKGYTNSGTAAANHAGQESCKVTCAGGSYVATPGAGCTNVTAGYWGSGGTANEKNGIVARTQCATGLTTIGYGPAADEAADCGHTLHMGDAIVHLRSEKRTKPALHVRIGDDIFYGDMSTELKGHIRVKIGDTVYSVFDDSM